MFNMSKLTKILRSARKFIADARSNSAIRRLRNMIPEDRERLGVSETSRGITRPNSSSNLVKTNAKIARIEDLTLSRKLHDFERKFPVNDLSYPSDKPARVNTPKLCISSEWWSYYEEWRAVKTVKNPSGNTTFYDYSVRCWKRIRTSMLIKSFFATFTLPPS